MRFCQDCINYNSCKRQGMDIPDNIVEKHNFDVIAILCHDFKDKQIHGRWIDVGKNIYEQKLTQCTHCGGICIDGGLFCTRCGAKMDLPNITDQTQAALSRMGAVAHGEE